MKKLLFLFLLISNNLFSADYYTLSDGSYSDATIWSLDGVNPCFCAPDCSIIGDNIYINHNVTMDCNIDIRGGSNLYVGPNGSLKGTFNIYARYGDMYVEGPVSCNKLIINPNRTVTVVGVLFETNNNVNIYGNLILDGAIFQCNSGNVTTREGGTTTLINGAWIKTAGNYQTYGITNICATCCIESTGGNIFVGSNNNNVGEVYGEGALYASSGNLNNYNFVESTINWCVFGSSTGMPMASNCTGVVAICTASPLSREESQLIKEINEEEFKDLILFMPNPNKGKLIFDSKVRGSFNLNIINLVGQLIYQDIIELIPGENVFNISIDKGVYILELKDYNNTYINRKIIYE